MRTHQATRSSLNSNFFLSFVGFHLFKTLWSDFHCFFDRSDNLSWFFCLFIFKSTLFVKYFMGHFFYLRKLVCFHWIKPSISLQSCSFMLILLFLNDFFYLIFLLRSQFCQFSHCSFFLILSLFLDFSLFSFNINI